MSELKTSGVKSVSGEYNFFNDATAGAIGNIRLGVNVPRFSWITGIWVTALTALSSAGAATVSFGTVVNPATVVNNNLMVANAFGSFTAQPLQGINLDANPLRIISDVEIIMAIGGFALSGGRLQFVLKYNENVI